MIHTLCEHGLLDSTITCAGIEVVCSDIPDPENGDIMFAEGTTSPFEVGTIATYICNLGYSLMGGDSARTCEGDGTQEYGMWSGLAPECVGEYCCLHERF